MLQIDTLLQKLHKIIDVLIIDDEPSFADLLEESLEHPLIQIHTANTYDDALKLIKKIDYWHFWIVDIRLDSGTETTNQNISSIPRLYSIFSPCIATAHTPAIDITR